MEVNAKLADVPLTVPEVIVVSSATVSIFQGPLSRGRVGFLHGGGSLTHRPSHPLPPFDRVLRES